MKVAKFRFIQTISFIILLVALTLAFTVNAACDLKPKLVKLPMPVTPIQVPVLPGSLK